MRTRALDLDEYANRRYSLCGIENAIDAQKKRERDVKERRDRDLKNYTADRRRALAARAASACENPSCSGETTKGSVPEQKTETGVAPPNEDDAETSSDSEDEGPVIPQRRRLLAVSRMKSAKKTESVQTHTEGNITGVKVTPLAKQDPNNHFAVHSRAAATIKEAERKQTVASRAKPAARQSPVQSRATATPSSKAKESDRSAHKKKDLRKPGKAKAEQAARNTTARKKANSPRQSTNQSRNTAAVRKEPKAAQKSTQNPLKPAPAGVTKPVPAKVSPPKRNSMLDRLLQEADPETYGPKSPAAPHSLSQSPPVKNSPLTPATTVAESPVAVPSNTQSPKQEVVRNTQNTSGEGMPIPADFTRDDEVDMAAADTAVDRWFKTLEAPQASNFAEFPHPRAFLNSLTPQHDPTSKKNAAGKGAVKKSVSKPAETRKKKGSIAAAAAPTGVSKKTRPHKSTSTRDPEWVNKVYGRR